MSAGYEAAKRKQTDATGELPFSCLLPLHALKKTRETRRKEQQRKLTTRCDAHAWCLAVLPTAPLFRSACMHHQSSSRKGRTLSSKYLRSEQLYVVHLCALGAVVVLVDLLLQRRSRGRRRSSRFRGSFRHHPRRIVLLVRISVSVVVSFVRGGVPRL